MTITLRKPDGTNVVLDPGCYVDGHHGQYAVDILSEVARDYGWLPEHYLDDPKACRELAERHGADDFDYWVAQNEADDTIMEWLNEHTDGGVWSWIDGEVFLELERTVAESEAAATNPERLEVIRWDDATAKIYPADGSVAITWLEANYGGSGIAALDNELRIQLIEALGGSDTWTS